METIFLIIAVLVGIVLIFLVYVLVKKGSNQKSNFLIGFLALLGVVLIAFPVFSSIQIQYGDLSLELNRLKTSIKEIRDTTNTKIKEVKDNTAIVNNRVNMLQEKLRVKQILNSTDFQQLNAPMHIIQPHP